MESTKAFESSAGQKGARAGRECNARNSSVEMGFVSNVNLKNSCGVWVVFSFFLYVNGRVCISNYMSFLVEKE